MCCSKSHGLHSLRTAVIGPRHRQEAADCISVSQHLLLLSHSSSSLSPTLPPSFSTSYSPGGRTQGFLRSKQALPLLLCSSPSSYPGCHSLSSSLFSSTSRSALQLLGLSAASGPLLLPSPPWELCGKIAWLPTVQTPPGTPSSSLSVFTTVL